MDTKARKTPEQDTLSGARFSPPDPKAGARHRPQAAKNELEKPESISRVSAKIFCTVFVRLIFAGCSCG
jgi:hypothetical protein